MITTCGAVPAAASSTCPIRSKRRNLAAGPVPDPAPSASTAAVVSPSRRSTWIHGHSGGAPALSRQAPQDTVTLAARAAASRARRVLPTPGSPASKTAPPVPAAVCRISPPRTASSASLPTSTLAGACPPTATL